MSRVRRFTVIVAISSVWLWMEAASMPAVAEVRLPHIFGDNMVLQRDLPVPVWGWAEPGEDVTVEIKDLQTQAKSDVSGRWRTTLPAISAGGPFELRVTGKNSLRFANVLVGEVWICSGQSNMAWPVSKAAKADEEIKAATLSNIRLFTVPMKTAGAPTSDVEAKWDICSPATVGDFSAVGYFFGRELHRKTDIPIGLIDTSWGGTAIEPWTPPVGFEQIAGLADFKKTIDKANQEYMEKLSGYLNQIDGWLQEAKKAVGQNQCPASMPAWPEHPLIAGGSKGPSSIYNAMVHPLAPFGIRGAIWYQGEANVLSNDGMVYHEKMKALINGWRTVWGQGEFPFYYVQLAPWQYASRYPGPGGALRLPGVWEAQTATLAVPNTGMAIITDIGNLQDIHPKNKQEVGRRLALWALAKNYGQKEIVYSGPIYQAMSVEGNRIRIRFDHVGGGLASRNDKSLNWFTIAGADQKFVDAQAAIDGPTVVVSSDQVPQPVAVRFGWHEEAEPNLMNKEGLPASPFRTDRW